VQIALTRGPHDAPAYDLLARIELTEARSSTTAQMADQAFSRAADAMELAWRASPLQAEYGRRLAWIYREWADQATTERDQRQTLLSQAIDALAAAQARAPADSRIASELNDTRRLFTEDETP
jgi:hypothetical protein